VEYFDEGTMNEQPQWVTEWDSMTEMRLPAAIRIALASRQADGTSLARQFVVPVMSKPFLQLQPGFINPFNSPVMAPRGGRGTALEDLRRSFEERLGRGRGRGNDPRTKK
jgi:hypothetical protein